ncbi:hypothetical protein RSAG8_11430, partial [Rhizoctonia solani AG-8 WAC10335]
MARAYALLDPADEYHARWPAVIDSWKPHGKGGDPTYHDVDSAGPQPSWWQDSEAWEYVQQQEGKMADGPKDISSAIRIPRKRDLPPSATPEMVSMESPGGSSSRPQRPVNFGGPIDKDKDHAPPTHKRRKGNPSSLQAPASSGSQPAPPVLEATLKLPISSSQGSARVNVLRDGIDGMGLGLSQRLETSMLTGLREEPSIQAAPAGSNSPAQSMPIVDRKAGLLFLPGLPGREGDQLLACGPEKARVRRAVSAPAPAPEVTTLGNLHGVGLDFRSSMAGQIGGKNP